MDTALLIDSVKIERPDRSPESGTMKRPTYSEIASGVSCRIQDLSGTVDSTTLGRIASGTFRVFFNSADVAAHDRLTDQNGKIYLVEHVDSLYPGYHIEVQVKETKP